MAEVDYFMAKFFGHAAPLPKPRVRPIYKPAGDHGYPWLCVGGGCYSYGDTAEHAYTRWRARLLTRRREDRVLWGT